MSHISGFAMLIVMVELIGFGVIVGGLMYLSYRFFPPFKKLVDKFVRGEL